MKPDILDLIISYEQDDLDSQESLTLFAHLIESGLAWSLQGHYGRTAAHLIEAGIISKEGAILVT